MGFFFYTGFCTRSFEKGNGLSLKYFCLITIQVNYFLLSTARSQITETNTLFWFSFEKRQFHLTTKKPEDKHTAQVLETATLSLTNSDFGELTGTQWHQSRLWLPSEREESCTKLVLNRINARCWYSVKKRSPNPAKFSFEILSLFCQEQGICNSTSVLVC